MHRMAMSIPCTMKQSQRLIMKIYYKMLVYNLCLCPFELNVCEEKSIEILIGRRFLSDRLRYNIIVYRMK
jgi:hypothetical protein